MSTVSTTITGTTAIATKTLTLAQRISLYEQRVITLTETGGEFPAGTYKFQITFGPRVVALAALAVSSGTVTGTLNLSTTQLEALFDVLPVDRLRCMAILWDTAGTVAWARSSVDIYRNEYTEESPTPVAVVCKVYQGRADIEIGDETVTIDLSSYGILASASVAGAVLVPDGSDNIFVVSVKLSTTQAVFRLSAPIGDEGYILTWMVAQ